MQQQHVGVQGAGILLRDWDFDFACGRQVQGYQDGPRRRVLVGHWVGSGFSRAPAWAYGMLTELAGRIAAPSVEDDAGEPAMAVDCLDGID